jgi:hypothetical protein
MPGRTVRNPVAAERELRSAQVVLRYTTVSENVSWLIGRRTKPNADGAQESRQTLENDTALLSNSDIDVAARDETIDH